LGKRWPEEDPAQSVPLFWAQEKREKGKRFRCSKSTIIFKENQRKFHAPFDFF